jgi:hypothetical protein
MTDLASVDYFSDGEIAQDPFEYFDHLRNTNPVFREPNYGVVVVTGYQEVVEGFKNSEALSAVTRSADRFHRCRSNPKATTSPSRSKHTVTCFRFPNTWS